ncbi:ATP-binding protein [Pelosinus sp. IPA-1]|uniref:sensor histidine kinase n=1 Tax=Pelosinus sp. IPA-1 TaxID=3029569 RepID=UPI0024361725|nr:ATP-binding protein [Pelosinus sp. IPA-1]GMB01485.1 two-component sensor histidine kinase [Pelosinus sp. IPA-1]
MFQKTLRKLTVLNSIVFLLIFIVFGGMLYGYIARQLFDDIDESMEEKVEAFRLVNGRPRLGGAQTPLFDSRILIFLQDVEGNVINPYPFPIEGISSEILTSLADGGSQWQTRKIQDHAYRLRTFPYSNQDNVLIKDRKEYRIKELLGVSIVDFEVTMLHRFLLVIVTGQIIGMTAIILAGYFLARRALVPIQAAWEKQYQFVADASHELRTPLTVIKSNAELLLRYPEHTIELETIRIRNVIRETIRMSKLVSTLLTLARADADEIEIQAVPVILNEVIQNVVEQFEPLVQMQKMKLKVDCSELISLVADKERLQQLFVILMDNAIKYTSEFGCISISCRKQSSQVVIKVIDTGIGIESKDLPYVFNRFFRADKVRTREKGGVGLGLAIAQWIVEKHCGKIWIKSEIGMGTEVYVSLPIEKS